MERPEQCVKYVHWYRSGIFIVNFEHISHIFLFFFFNFEHISCPLVHIVDFEQLNARWQYGQEFSWFPDFWWISVFKFLVQIY